MRWSRVFSVVGVLVVFIGIAMILPLAVGLYYGEKSSVAALLESMSLAILAGAAMYAPGRKTRGPLSHREGMAIVALGWGLAGLFGAFPFYFGHMLPSFCDAAFESISGFTTTGSTVMTSIETAPLCLLLWRSLIQWLGGMGIIVLGLAILPFLGVGGMQLYKAEVPSPVPDKLTPRIRDTAALLWKVYALFTVLEVVLLLIGGMSLYDSVSHAFTTMPTGGFSPKNLSIGQYDNAYFDWVIFFFMLLAGINFSLHYQALKGRVGAFWKDPECRIFLLFLVLLIAIVFVDVRLKVYPDTEKSLRYAAFQVMSIITTTGYATADYELWPHMSQLILLLCMFIGASAGSTGGGIKVLRVLLLFKYLYRELFRLIHPRSVVQVKLGGRPVPDDVLQSICGFFLLYVGLFALCSVILSALGVDMITSLGAVAATMGNIGPGIGGVGPMDHFGWMPQMAKWLLMLCMLLGRLEIYTVIILFVPEFWRK